jgi:N-acetylmuramoyl-L-alanine amidase
MDTRLNAVGSGACEVQPGDSVASIAAGAGHLPATIWNDPANAALKEARTDPELLVPGDRLTVMPLRAKTVSCATGRTHVFRALLQPIAFAIVVEDEDGTPFASKKWKLTADGQSWEGETGADGRIAVTLRAAATKRGVLTIWLDEPGLPDPWIREVFIGTLFPIEDLRGVQQRLANLGFYDGAVDGVLGPATAAAIRVFQTEQQLDVTGAADASLAEALTAAHRV